MSDADKSKSAQSDFDVVEVESVGTDDDGNIVIDDVVIVTDHEGHVLAMDETVAVLDAHGDAVVDEVVSVVGEDGTLHVVEEDVAVLEEGDED
jgi:hypothetical protein